MPEEIFDVVDANDCPVGQASRSAIHRHGWLHRAVHIFVFNAAGQLLVHKRSATKDEYPGRYTSSASGHVDAGETYAQAARRELHEELELSRPVEYLRTFAAGAETANEHTALYRTVTDEPPNCDPGEIETFGYHPLSEVARMLREDPEQFTPSFRTLFAWYWEQFG